MDSKTPPESDDARSLPKGDELLAEQLKASEARYIEPPALLAEPGALHKRLIELELAYLYKTTPIGLAVLDRDLRFVRINDVLAAVNGRLAEVGLLPIFCTNAVI